MSSERIPDQTDVVQSVSKAISLLHCFVDGDQGLTLSELARRTGLNPSTAYRLLRTLIAGGMLSRADGTELYVRGPVLMALAQQAFVASDLGDALSNLQVLADDIGLSTSLGARDQHCAVVLLRALPAHPLRFERAAGSRVPLHASAMGKALLAFSGEGSDAAVRALGPLESRTERTITSPSSLAAELDLARLKGFAVTDEEWYVGVHSIGVPIRDEGGVARLALAAQGPASGLDEHGIEAIAAALQRTAAILERLPVARQLGTAAPWAVRVP